MMAARLRASVATVSVGLLTLLVAGCSYHSKPSRKPDIEGGLRKNIPALDRTLSEIDMQQIGLAYGECVDAGAGPPKNAKELLVNLNNMPKYKKALESGDVVIAWGADPRHLPADTIIGYQKRPMEDGRLIVLIGNSGTPAPQVYTKAQFDAAQKAPGLEGTGKQHGGRTR